MRTESPKEEKPQENRPSTTRQEQAHFSSQNSYSPSLSESHCKMRDSPQVPVSVGHGDDDLYLWYSSLRTLDDYSTDVFFV